MNIINTFNDKRFTLNGIQYFKNYVSVVRGNKVEIFNCYEQKDVLVELTHYNQFSINGAVYTSAALLQAALLPIIYSRINMGDGSTFAQNNIGKTINLGYNFGDISTAAIVSKMNSKTTVISATDTPVVLSLYSLPTIITNQTPNNKKYLYLFTPGAGTYGINGATVTTEMIFQLATLNLTPEDIQNDPGAIIYNLDPVVNGNYIVKANGSTWNFSDSGDINQDGIVKTYYFSYSVSDALYLAQFKGTPGIYGLGNTLFEEDDFAATTNSNITPTPTFEQILAEGGNKNISQLTNNGDGTSPYTTVAKLNGLTITVNQAAAEMYLKNHEGTTLATVNLAFLNNEGTTFFYNSTTKNLELKNDSGVILSVVPVSAFVSNLIQSVNFNGTTPSILEFKDAAGNVVASSTFTINNIAGLQAALDAKVSQTITNGVTTSAPSQDAVFDALFLKADKTTTLRFVRELGAGEDLNAAEFRGVGLYFQNLNSGATIVLNYPVQSAGKLEVTSYGAYTYQTYHSISGVVNTLFTRNYINGTWSGWKKIAGDSDVLHTTGNETKEGSLTLTGNLLPNSVFASGRGKFGGVELNLNGVGDAVFPGQVTVPAATAIGSAVNKGQMDTALALKANLTGGNSFSGKQLITINDTTVIDILNLINYAYDINSLTGEIKMKFGFQSVQCAISAYKQTANSAGIKFFTALGYNNEFERARLTNVGNFILGDAAAADTLHKFQVEGTGRFTGQVSVAAGTGASSAVNKSQLDAKVVNGIGGMIDAAPSQMAVKIALDAKADLVGGKIPVAQLPSYVDDVLEYANLAAFPATGETGKLYIAIDSNLVYRWGGTSYVVTSTSLALGETSTTAGRGDRAKIAFDHSLTTGNPHGTTVNDITGLQTTIDAKVTQTITNGVTTTAPSENAVFQALAAPKANVTATSSEFTTTMDSHGRLTFTRLSDGSTINLYLAQVWLEGTNRNFYFPDETSGVVATREWVNSRIGYVAPSSATDIGVKGEIRITSTYVYYCINTNTWVRTVAATW